MMAIEVPLCLFGATSSAIKYSSKTPPNPGLFKYRLKRKMSTHSELLELHTLCPQWKPDVGADWGTRWSSSLQDWCSVDWRGSEHPEILGVVLVSRCVVTGSRVKCCALCGKWLTVWLYVLLQDLVCSAAYYVGSDSLCGCMCCYRIWGVVLCTMWEVTLWPCVLTGSGV